MSTLSIDLLSKPIEPFQYPYYRIYWNGSCYIEDTVEDKTVDLDISPIEGWNSFIFEIIDVFDVFDPLDGTLLAQTGYDILDLRINGSNSWPVETKQGRLQAVGFHSDHATWYSDRSSSAKIQGKIKDLFTGKGFTEIKFKFENGVVVDHYYADRNQINYHHWLSKDHIKDNCYGANLFGLSNVRLKDTYTTTIDESSNTYETFWGGRSVSIECEFKDHLAQWISKRAWPYRWIHAKYYNQLLPEHLANELLNV